MLPSKRRWIIHFIFFALLVFSPLSSGEESSLATESSLNVIEEASQVVEGVPKLIEKAYQKNLEQWSPARIHQVVAIKGNNLPMLLGRDFTDLSVMVVENDSFKPIPFQFDDIDRKGFPYVPGGKIAIRGSENILEEYDELVFMLKDTGEKANKEQLTHLIGTVLSVLEISDGRISRYAYIVEGNKTRSNKIYASFNKKTGLIKTDFYTLKTRKRNILDWSDLIYKSYSTEKSLLDTMKIRITAKLGPLRYKLHNRLIPSKVLAVKNGPVRSLISVDISLSILGVQLTNAGALINASANSMVVPVFAKVPNIARVLSDFYISFSLDFNELENAKIMTALGPKEAITVGDYENSNPDMLQVSLKHNWITGTSSSGWDIITFFNYSEYFEPKLGLLYKDIRRGDKPDRPERFKGSQPQIGYILKDIPVGQDIQFGINAYFGDGFWDYGPGKSVNEFRKPVTTSVFTLEQALQAL